MSSERRRCPWCGADPLYVAYHDDEWGVPSRDDRHLFEMLVLEGAQAGLSWITILRKRENYRRAMAGLDPAAVARFGSRSVERLLRDPGIVRNRLKLESTIDNAKAFLRLQEEHGSFADWLWSFTDGEPIVNRPRSMDRVPARTTLSDTISKELKRRGFRFVGSTIVYAYLQATGVVDDHLATCWRTRRR
jgi:DNA-3-methyladenine glycosylase I